MELSNFAFYEEFGVLHEELPRYFLKKRELKRRFADGDIKLCVSQEKGVEWLIVVHNQRSPHRSMVEMIS